MGGWFSQVDCIQEKDPVGFPGVIQHIRTFLGASDFKRIREAGLKSKMVLQIHDELLFDAVPEEIEELGRIVVAEMENVITLSIPLTVECNYGKNWLEAH